MAKQFVAASPDPIDIGDWPPVDISGTELSIHCFATCASFAAERKFIAKFQSPGSQFQYLLSFISSNKLQAAVNRDPTEFEIAVGTTNLSVDTWYSCGLRRNSSLTEAMLEGVSDGTATASGNIQNSSAPFVLGAGGSAGAPEQPHDGWLKDVAVWNISLDNSQFASLAAGADPRTIEPLSLKLFTLFDESLRVVTTGLRW